METYQVRNEIELIDGVEGQQAILDTLVNGAIALATAGLVISLSAQIVGDIGATLTANSFERNATTNANNGLDSMAERLPTVGVVLGAVVVIGLLVAGFRGFGG